MRRLKPLFRYAGSKHKMLQCYQPFFQGLRPQYTIDYFGGSGIMSVWFQHLYPEAKRFLNEKDPALYNLFSTIQQQFLPLQRKIHALERVHTRIWKGMEKKKRFYYGVRDDYNAKDFYRETDEAAAFLCLRTWSFSGRNARNAQGHYSTSAGIRSVSEACFRQAGLRQFRRMVKNTTLLNAHYADLALDLPQSLHYLDPPYVESDPTVYNFAFDWDETARLCQFAQRLAEKHTVFMSNNYRPRLIEMMEGFAYHVFDVRGQMQRQKKTDPLTQEVLFYKIYPDIVQSDAGQG